MKYKAASFFQHFSYFFFLNHVVLTCRLDLVLSNNQILILG